MITPLDLTTSFQDTQGMRNIPNDTKMLQSTQFKPWDYKTNDTVSLKEYKERFLETY